MKSALIMLGIYAILWLEPISRHIPILDFSLSIITIILLIWFFVFLFKKVKNAIIQYNKIEDEKRALLHKENSEFLEYARNTYEKNKKILNKERRIYIGSLTVGFLLFAIVFYIFVDYFQDGGDMFEKIRDGVLYIIAMFATFVILAFITEGSTKRYKCVVENHILKDFVGQFKFGLKYYVDCLDFNEETNYAGDKFSEVKQEYRNAQFTNIKDIIWKIEDYVCGRYNEVPLECMDMHLTAYIDTPSGPAQRTIFYGNFIIIDKNVSGTNLKYWSVSKSNNEEQNDNEFNSYFKGYETMAEDPYLIFELKKFLVEFRKKYNLFFDIDIKDKIYIRFHTDNIFNLSLLEKNPITKDSIYSFSTIMKFIEDLLDFLNK